MLFGWALALLAIALFCRLGIWQLARMHEKQAMLDASAQVLDARAPHPLSAATDPQRARDYEWAQGGGYFIDAPAVLLDNQIRQGRPGVHAYRVFEAADGGQRLLVDLGWLPLPADRRMPEVSLPVGSFELRGLLAPPPAAGIVAGTPALQPNGTLLAVVLDTQVLEHSLHQPALAPRVLRLDPSIALGYERDLAMLANTLTPERHLGYAVQWFGLALAVLVTALVFTLRRWRAERKH